MTVTAMSRPQFASPAETSWVRSMARPTWIVKWSLVFVTSSGQRKLFQVNMNESMPSVTMAGRARGTMIRVRIQILLQPSTRAASSSSRGMPRKNCRSRKAPKG